MDCCDGGSGVITSSTLSFVCAHPIRHYHFPTFSPSIYLRTRKLIAFDSKTTKLFCGSAQHLSQFNDA